MFEHRNYNIRSFIPVSVERSFLIDGADVYCQLCPVSSVTGYRQNPLELLKVLSNDPAWQRNLAVVLQEIPSVIADDKLSSEDKFAFLRHRFLSGTPSEDLNYSKLLASAVDDYLAMLDLKLDPAPAPAPVPAPDPDPAPAS